MDIPATENGYTSDHGLVYEMSRFEVDRSLVSTYRTKIDGTFGLALSTLEVRSILKRFVNRIPISRSVKRKKLDGQQEDLTDIWDVQLHFSVREARLVVIDMFQNKYAFVCWKKGCLKSPNCDPSLLCPAHTRAGVPMAPVLNVIRRESYSGFNPVEDDRDSDERTGEERSIIEFAEVSACFYNAYKKYKEGEDSQSYCTIHEWSDGEIQKLKRTLSRGEVFSSHGRIQVTYDLPRDQLLYYHVRSAKWQVKCEISNCFHPAIKGRRVCICHSTNTTWKDLARREIFSLCSIKSWTEFDDVMYLSLVRKIKTSPEQRLSIGNTEAVLKVKDKEIVISKLKTGDRVLYRLCQGSACGTWLLPYTRCSLCEEMDQFSLALLATEWKPRLYLSINRYRYEDESEPTLTDKPRSDEPFRIAHNDSKHLVEENVYGRAMSLMLFARWEADLLGIKKFSFGRTQIKLGPGIWMGFFDLLRQANCTVDPLDIWRNEDYFLPSGEPVAPMFCANHFKVEAELNNYPSIYRFQNSRECYIGLWDPQKSQTITQAKKQRVAGVHGAKNDPTNYRLIKDGVKESFALVYHEKKYAVETMAMLGQWYAYETGYSPRKPLNKYCSSLDFEPNTFMHQLRLICYALSLASYKITPPKDYQPLIFTKKIRELFQSDQPTD